MSWESWVGERARCGQLSNLTDVHLPHCNCLNSNNICRRISCFITMTLQFCSSKIYSLKNLLHVPSQMLPPSLLLFTATRKIYSAESLKLISNCVTHTMLGQTAIHMLFCLINNAAVARVCIHYTRHLKMALDLANIFKQNVL